MITILIINIKESVDRKEQILKQIKNFSKKISTVFIDAVNKNSITEEFIAENCDFYKTQRRTNGEIACALSHRKAYQYILDNNLSNAVIVEDDIIFAKDFENTILQIIDSSQKLLNAIIKLDCSTYNKMYATKQSLIQIKVNKNKYTVSYPITRQTFAWGYFIDNKAAKTMLTYWPKVSYVADEWEIYKTKINTFQLLPPIVDENTDYSNISCIEQSRYKNTNKVKKSVLLKQLKRIIYHITSMIKTYFPISFFIKK